LAKLDPKTKAILTPKLPPTASLNNPIDLIGDASEARYDLALEAILADPNVDGVIVIVVPTTMMNLDAIASLIARQAKSSHKPVFPVLMATGDIERSIRIFDDAKIPHYKFPEDAARSLSAMARYAHWRSLPKADTKEFSDIDREMVRKTIAQAKREGRRFLPEPEAHAVLKAYGLPILRSKLAKTSTEAVNAAREIGYPVVLKIVSPQIVHKVDVGGVKLNLRSDNDVRTQYDELIERVKNANKKAEIWGVFVQEMVLGGKETILGMKRDPHFGPLLMFGLGGIYVEVLKDVTFRIAPIHELGARQMIEGIKSIRLLEGFRGEPPSDLEAISQALSRLSQLVIDFPEIEEMDINPLMVLPLGSGARVVDARILI
jgi:acetyltransferase